MAEIRVNQHEADASPDRKQKQLSHELSTSKDLLAEYVSLVEEYEVRDKILLGMDVTPANIFSTLISLFIAVVTILTRASGMGVLEHENLRDALKDIQAQGSEKVGETFGKAARAAAN